MRPIYPNDYYIGERAKQVLELVCEGLMDKEIAIKLNITKPCVTSAIRTVRARFGDSNRVELAIWAIKNKVVSLDMGNE